MQRTYSSSDHATAVTDQRPSAELSIPRIVGLILQGHLVRNLILFCLDPSHNFAINFLRRWWCTGN